MKLGDHVKDKITGYEGVITGIADYITGCKQMSVTSRNLKPDGDSISNWIDEVRLEVVPGKEIALSPVAGQNGGPSIGPKSQFQSPPKR